MTGGGLISLVAYGSQNVLLSGNPQMTYFYKAFKRYTHFAMENVTTALEGPNELYFDQPIRLRAKVQRVGDLLSDMYFTFRLPDIYSKYLTPTAQRSAQFQFQWVHYIGASIIQSAAFFVGGQKIHEVDGTYLIARALADYGGDYFTKWSTLIGDTKELTDPAKGIYAGGTNATGYPSVFQNPTTGLGNQQNRPSIFGQDISVPLDFWFTQTPSNALPLVGLQYHECEVQITLNPSSHLYTYLDASGFRVAPNYRMNASASDIRMNIPAYGQTSDLSGQIKYFLTDWGVSPPSVNQWFLNPRIQSTYIYLPQEEQKLFATQPLSYLIYQVTNYPFLGIYNRQLLDLETHNPINRILFVPRRSDSATRNDRTNFTNWWNFPYPPYYPTPGQTPMNTSAFSSGLLVPQGQMNIIRALRILCDGNEIQEEKPIEYFTKLVPLKYVTGVPNTLIPMYSFELNTPGPQPSGSINGSRIRNFQVELDVYPLPSGTTYTYDLNIYVENMNFFEVASGMGGLKYAL
jgi:Major capsid protein N-terminus/Large eukaryotic DNA virus major capsid protein